MVNVRAIIRFLLCRGLDRWVSPDEKTNSLVGRCGGGMLIFMRCFIGLPAWIMMVAEVKGVWLMSNGQYSMPPD